MHERRRPDQQVGNAVVIQVTGSDEGEVGPKCITMQARRAERIDALANGTAIVQFVGASQQVVPAQLCGVVAPDVPVHARGALSTPST